MFQSLNWFQGSLMILLHAAALFTVKNILNTEPTQC